MKRSEKAKSNYKKIKEKTLLILNFFFDKRYYIGGFAFIILVAFGIHGSSINIYDNYIQPNIKVESTEPLLGKNRPIRSDEWAVSSPVTLSQIPNNMEENSDILNASEKNVTMYPKTPAKSLVTLASPNLLGYLFLPPTQAFAFSWWFGYFFLFFCTLELLMLLTKKNKLFSTLGAIMITFAPAVQWWEAWNIIAYGEFAIILFHYFLKSKKLYKQILLALTIGLAGCCYIMCLYPAWQVPYAYVFLVLAIWVIIQNKQYCSVKKFAILFASIIGMIAIIIIPTIIKSSENIYLTTHTVYPGARVSTGGDDRANLFDYYNNLFLPFKTSDNSSATSQFISLFPLPIIMSIYYWFSDRKSKSKDFLLISLTILSILLCIWNFIPLPAWLTKITLLSVSLPRRTVNVVEFISVVLLIYCLSKYQTNKRLDFRTSYQNLIIAIFLTSFGVYIAYHHSLYVGPGYFTLKMVLIDLLLFIPISFLLLNNHKKGNVVALLSLSLITFISGFVVHPLSKGLSVLYDKPVAQEIRKIEDSDSEAKWLSVGTDFPVNNYLITTGANVINSTNYFPNNSLWETLDLENENEIYNRYSHMFVNLTKENSSLSLISYDYISLNLNNNDICKLDVNYIYTINQDLDQYDTNSVNFEKIYDEDNAEIYKVKCSEQNN